MLMPTFTCEVCGMCLHSDVSLTRHMRTHGCERPYQCPVCDRRYRDRSNLDQHMRTHTYERSYKCPVCEHIYRQREGLNRHMRTHTGDISFQCDVCESRFRNRAGLNRHMLFCHRTSGIYGAQATTHTQHTESSHGIANTVATVNSSRGTAIVTTVRSTSPLVMTAVSQASGTVTVTHLDLKRDYGNECPICFDSLNDGETITTPCCNKIFHIACLRRLSLDTEFSCPNCRGVLTRDWLSKTPGL